MPDSSMACSSSSDVTVTVNGLSIHGSIPSSYIGVRWAHNGASGATSGVEVPAYTADGGTTAITITANQRFWIQYFQIVAAVTGNVSLYRGTSTSADGTVNNMLARGVLANNGGLIMNFPTFRLGLAEKIYLKAAGVGQIDCIGYGFLETL